MRVAPLCLVAFLGFLGCGGSTSATSVADAAVDAAVVEDTATDDAPSVEDAATTDVATADTTTADAVVDAPPPPTCPVVAPCPATPAGIVEGSGPRAIEKCAFSLKPSGSYDAALAGLAGALTKASIADVLGDLNRTATNITASSLPGVPGFARGFAWDDDDNGKEWWIPQGLSGTPDGYATGVVAGKKAVVVTWYYEASKHPGSTGEKGIRISIADVTTTTVKYRHLLLVEPTVVAGRADFKAIDIHAGGIAWVGDRLWVVDTGQGLREFDLSRMFEVSTAKDEIGWDGAVYQGGLYKYIVPQSGFWRDASKCNPVFSFVGLDRGSTPPALVTGEYSADTITGKIFRWPVDLATGALAPTTFADGAFVMGQRQVQGGITHEGAFLMVSSAPAAGKGVLYAARPGKKTISYPWADAPEEIMFDAKANLYWGNSEGLNKRWVFAVSASAIKVP